MKDFNRLRVFKVLKVFKVSKVPKVPKVFKVLKVLKVLKVDKALTYLCDLICADNSKNLNCRYIHPCLHSLTKRGGNLNFFSLILRDAIKLCIYCAFAFSLMLTKYRPYAVRNFMKYRLHPLPAAPEGSLLAL
mgnify:FL=1